MPLFIREDSKKLKNRQITIPDAVAKKLYQNMNMYAKDKTSNGYKRLKALTDKSYNKRSEKKDNQHNNNMTVSFGDARRIVHDMSHMPQTPKNKEFNMIGGYDTLYALKNGLKQARSSVKQVKQVPEVPKLEKNPTKTPDVKDSIKMGSANITISEEVNNLNGRKTLYITEKQMKVIKEYHNQLKIPFNDPSKPYDLKVNYEHLIDFFEAIGKYGKLPSVKVNMNNPSKYIYQYISDFIYGNTEWVESYDFNSIQLFINFIQEYHNVDKFFAADVYPLNQVRELCLNKEIDVDDLVDCGLISEDDIEEYERNLDPFDLLSNNGLLTDEGVETYKNEFLIPHIKDYLDDHFYNIETDSRGLIRIEREIHIPNINATWVNNEKNVTHYSNNYYTELMKKYDGIGVCWSYLRGGAEAYCGSSFGSGTYSAIIVGYVSPDDVNWVDTICLNFNNYEEYELRLNEGAVVEINEVLVKPIGNSKNVEKMHLPIRNTILVKA